MELDKRSSDLTTFMTPFGRYKFNRVPFGLNNAPEMFQRKMVETFGDLPGVVVYFDDICIIAESKEEHDKILGLVIERARVNGIKFNFDKIQYRTSQVKFMGHILAEGTIKPDSKYIEAISKIKRPENKHDVMRLLGLFKYLAKFIPNLSKLSAGLRDLTRNDVEFKWTEKHDIELNKLLKIVSSNPVLAIYDPRKSVIIQTDASKEGLGCVLLQDGHPVAFASRTLNKSEQKWAQIEKELLAICFACEKFHYFLYGREFTVESDHKPLETLVKRVIDDVTMRLQRMFMFLLKYPLINIVHKPGKEMLVADCLSRAQLPESDDIKELNGIIHSVTKSVCISENNYKYYRSIIAQDEKYSRICNYIENGWPGFHKLDDLAQVFHKFKDELHYENGLLFKNHKLIIPTEMQQKIAKWLHAPHLGIEKTLARGRLYYFWPGMVKQIKEVVLNCSTCEKFKRNNQKEPLVQEETARYPFHIVSMDLFEYGGRDYIAIIDAYSGYLISEQLNGKTSNKIIDVILRIFERIGYPTIIKCDNSPFSSAEFDQFANKSNIQFKFSSPRYPQSNGMAEKGVAIAKNILKRCFEVNELHKFQYRILERNTTPVASMRLTPAELFFGRIIRTKLPVSETLLYRSNLSEKSVQEQIQKKKESQKYYYNRNAKTLPVLNVGDLVIFKKNGKEWNYGTINNNVNGRSYIIRDSFDNLFRRNRRFIRQTNNTGFNSSDLLLEENFKNKLNKLRENENKVQIVPPVNVITNNIIDPIKCNTHESELPSERSSDNRELENEELGNTDSEVNLDNNCKSPQVNNFMGNSENYRTRSNRLVKPPQRYGW